MPNTGKPSRDCHLCRARRVKVRCLAHIRMLLRRLRSNSNQFRQCDLGRPSCLRCIKYGKECPGYREPLDLVFQNENASSLGKSRGKPDRKKTAAAQLDSREAPRRRAVSKAASSTKSGHWTVLSTWSRSLTSSEERWLTPLSSPLTQSLHVHSVPLLLDQYSFHSPTLQHTSSASRYFGYHDFLPQMLQIQEETCLKLVVDAFADAFLKNQSNATWKTSYRSSGVYGKALRAVNESLRDSKMELEDSTLAAVWLLANYEVRSPRKCLPICEPHPWWTSNSCARCRSSSHLPLRLGLLHVTKPVQATGVGRHPPGTCMRRGWHVYFAIEAQDSSRLGKGGISSGLRSVP